MAKRKSGAGGKYSTFDRRVIHSPRGRVESYPRTHAKGNGPSDAELRAVMMMLGKDGTTEGCMSCSHHFAPGEFFRYGTKGAKLRRVCIACVNAGQVTRVHMIGRVRPVLWDMPSAGRA